MNMRVENTNDLVRQAFSFSGTLTKARIKANPGLSAAICRVELAMAARLREDAELVCAGKAKLPLESYSSRQSCSREERALAQGQRLADVLALMNVPVTRSDICDMMDITNAQAAKAIQQLVVEGKAKPHGKRIHLWTYINMKGIAAIAAELRHKEAALAKAAAKANSKALTPTEMRRREVLIMVKLDVPRKEIAYRLKISEASVKSIIHKARGK